MEKLEDLFQLLLLIIIYLEVLAVETVECTLLFELLLLPELSVHVDLLHLLELFKGRSTEFLLVDVFHLLEKHISK